MPRGSEPSNQVRVDLFPEGIVLVALSTLRDFGIKKRPHFGDPFTTA
nr:MAG TPA: hypothetical protein [Caudoviricetes sp.]